MKWLILSQSYTRRKQPEQIVPELDIYVLVEIVNYR